MTMRKDRIRRDLRATLGDGLAFSLMVGVGETYVPAFALALGLSEVASGWIVSVPLLLGAALQLVSPAAIRRLRSHRRWVVLCAGGQAVCCLAYLVLALLGSVPAIVLFVVATMYWGTGMAGGPAWNTWVGTLIPERLRTSLFARRARLCQAGTLVGFVAGGIALQWGTRHDDILAVFAALFLCAALARGVSTWFLWSQSEPEPLPADHRSVSAREMLRRARSSADGRLLVFMLAIQVSVQITGPFFTPYMLGELRLSYLEFLLIIATAFAAKMIAYPLLGLLAKRIGNQRLLRISAVCIIPLSALWIVSDDLRFLLGVQVCGGVIWAGYELATLLLLFERIQVAERTSVLTLFNLANAVALVAGALIGGLLLGALGADREAYHVLFAVSGGARVLAVLPVGWIGRRRALSVQILPRVLGVRPNSGSLDAPMVTTLPETRTTRPR